MKPVLCVCLTLFILPFLLYDCNPPVCECHPPVKYLLEIDQFEISGSVYDEHGRRRSGRGGYRVGKTDWLQLHIHLEDMKPWTFTFLRKGGEAYGYPTAMACSCPGPSYNWDTSDPLKSVDFFAVDVLTGDTISISEHLRIILPGNRQSFQYDISYVSDLFDIPIDRYGGREFGRVSYKVYFFKRPETFPESVYFFGKVFFSSGRTLESPDTPQLLFE